MDPRTRECSEADLDKRVMTSVFPDEAYKDSEYEWDYSEDE